LFNQGYILADAFVDDRGIYVDAHAVEERDGKFYYEGKQVVRQSGKMGKSLKNSVNPDDMYDSYGADSLRLYEMAMGPLDTGRPWSDTGIVGLYRFLQRFWRNVVDEETGQLKLSESPADDETRRLVHKTIAGVREDMDELRFNTAISKLIELNNHLTKVGYVDRETAEYFVLMLAPLAPHIAEEVWAKLGNDESVTWHPFPVAQEEFLIQKTVEIPVQVQGKVRGKIVVEAGTPDARVESLALAEENVARHLEGKTVRKIVIIPDRMVNIVAG
jgi:leucyl-tRNA synthetase